MKNLSPGMARFRAMARPSPATTGMVTKNVFLRQSQFRLAAEPWFCLKLARKLVGGSPCNGWDIWYYRDEGDELKPIEALRYE